MNYIVLVGDGMADRPVFELGGRTPLQVAHTPNMDYIAMHGVTGAILTIPDGCPEGSDVANLSLLGYDPRRYYTGRGPLEAASLDIPLKPDDVVFRCNLVTLSPKDSSYLMADYCAGHPSDDEAHSLIGSLDEAIGSEWIHFYAGRSYRHIMLWRGGRCSMKLVPPHDIIGLDVAPYLPQGDGADTLRDLMEKSAAVLRGHPVNCDRQRRGLPLVTHIWLWGQGRPPQMPSFSEKYGLSGAVIAAVDLIRGIGRSLGLSVVDVPGITGFIDTNYVGKAEYALEALRTHDFVYVHVEAPDEMGHAGDARGKVKAIEEFDAKVVGTVLRGLSELGPHKLLLATDHPTPISLRTHSRELVPFAVYSSANVCNRSHPFDERLVEAGELNYSEGHRLMADFLAGLGG